jgi:hypothetical protein
MLGGAALGADAFIAFYGLRYTLTDAEMDAVEQNSDERVVAARRAKLQTYSGRLTDGQPSFLLVGTRLGVFGLENESERSVDGAQLEQIMRDTAAKLQTAGLPGAPQLHLQFEAQY